MTDELKIPAQEAENIPPPVEKNPLETTDGFILPSNWARNFGILFSGQFISGFTTFIVQYAFLWYLADKIATASALTLAQLVIFLPYVLFLPLSGVLADRLNKKVILIGMDILAATVAVILSLLGATSGGFSLTWILLAMFVRSTAQAFQSPAMQSTVPYIVPEAQLTRIGGMNSMTHGLMGLIAPGVAAFLYGILPMYQIILLDVVGATFAVSTVLLTKIPKPKHKANLSVQLFWTEFKDGLAELRTHKGILQWAIFSMVMFAVLMPALALYPLMTTQHFNGTIMDAGIVEMLWGLGSLLGGLLIVIIGKFKDRYWIIFMGFAAVGICMFASGLFPGTRVFFWIFAVINLIAGTFFMGSQGPFFAIVQESIVPEKMGRVMSVMGLVQNVGGPIGLMFSTPLAEKIGVTGMFTLSGGVLLVMMALSLFMKNMRWVDPKAPSNPMLKMK
ncbi:MAG: MFS transporter [Streptococcaceae bacterium]|jgi:DHA3 family macrolide efflux protein-like MFS transporter|nr:MFS transporter [Streptococcaceae bacterium]